MLKRVAPGLVASSLLLAGCVFGGGKGGTTSSNNGVSNNGMETDLGAASDASGDTGSMPGSDAAGDPDAGNPDPDGGPADDMQASDDMGRMPVLSEATTERINCLPNPVLWLEANDPDLGTIPGDAVVTASSSPSAVGNDADAPSYEASVAWASVDGTTLEVVVGGIPVLGAAPSIAETYSATTTVPAGTEVGDIWLLSREARADGGVVFDTQITTSDGVYSCVYTVAGSDAQGSCSRGEFQSVLDGEGLVGVRQVDLLIRGRLTANQNIAFDPFKYALAASGPTTTGDERLAALSIDYNILGIPSVSRLDLRAGIEDTITGDGHFFPRLAFGATRDHALYPALMALGEENGRLQPHLLFKNPDAPTYARVDSLPTWRLAPGVDPQPKRFTFLDGYELSLSPAIGGAQIDPSSSQVLYGWAALVDSRLILSRPGRTAGSDFLFADAGAAAHEMRAYRSLPTDPGVGETGYPYIFVVLGANRDRVAVMQWNFSADVEVVADIVDGGATDVRNLGFMPALVDGQGIVAFTADVDGLRKIGLFVVADDNPDTSFANMVCADR